VDEVYGVELDDVLRAKDLLASSDGVSARDALHVAVMDRVGVRRIVSFDRGFDGVEGLERIWE
jgi:predicted nucleic acid-binding protein